MEEAQAKSKFKHFIEHKSLKIQRYTYSPGDKVCVWCERIVDSRVGEFIRQYTVLHHNEHFMIAAMYQDGVIKRHYTS